MSLSRQLLLIILGLFFAVFAGTFTISVNSARHFLAEQLETHAQDTATSLGLSLSPYMQKQDLATMGRMVDAIYDRGYYQSIQVESVDGLMLIERSNSIQFEGIPTWFVDLLQLETPLASAVIMSGWKQAGWVRVSSHPGYAYAELWRNTVQTFWLFMASALLALFLGLIALRYILTPLRAVERQAEAICRQEYPVQEKLPRARELRRMVEAMNRMASRIKQTFDQQAKLVERLRQQAYQDSLTMLGNRRYFNDQLDHLTASSEELNAGGLLLVELYDFKGFNERNGYELGDRMLKEAGRVTAELAQDWPGVVAARIGGASFALLLTDATVEQLDELAARLNRALLRLTTSGLADRDEVAHTGVAAYRAGDTANDLLSRADMALRKSQSQGPNTWHRYRDADVPGVARTASEWKAVLERVVGDRNILLFTQAVLSNTVSESSVLHKEILLRIPDSDVGLLPAGAFMPMAEQLGLARVLDKLAVEKLIGHLSASDADTGSYAINLSSNSLHDSSFRDWLLEQVDNIPRIATQLIFEFSECAVLRDLEVARTLTARLKDAGCRCNIDHFGRGFASFSYLCSMRLHSIKVDGGFIRNVASDPDNQFFIQELTRTLHSIDLQVIAENVESDRQRSTLLKLGVDGVQGFLTGKPEPFC